VIDDASTDATTDVAAEYTRANADRMTLVAQRVNKGVAQTMAAGLTSAPPAAYVATLNDDDTWEPGFLERQVAMLDARPELALAFAEARVVDGHGRPTGQLFSDLFGRLDPVDPLADLLRSNHACASTLVMREEVARTAGLMMPASSLVWDYFVVLVSAGLGGVGFNEEPLARYRISDGGMHLREAEMWRDTTAARTELLNNWPAIIEKVGGRRAARRRAALLALDVVATRHAGSWREFGWHGRALLAQRQVRPAVWLALYGARKLIGLTR
jgi:glycosyltransferase involved in cell wall biosynthesis